MNGRWLILLSVVFLVSFRDAVIIERVEEVRAPRPQFGTLPPDCSDLFDNQHHEAWAECMGVGYRRGEEKND